MYVLIPLFFEDCFVCSQPAIINIEMLCCGCYMHIACIEKFFLVYSRSLRCPGCGERVLSVLSGRRYKRKTDIGAGDKRLQGDETDNEHSSDSDLVHCELEVAAFSDSEGEEDEWETTFGPVSKVQHWLLLPQTTSPEKKPSEAAI